MIQHDQEMPCYQQRMPVVSPFDPGSSYKPRGPVTFQGRTVELRGGRFKGTYFITYLTFYKNHKILKIPGRGNID